MGIGTIGEQIFTVAQWVLFGGLVLLFAPFRHTTRFRRSRMLKATAQQVWDKMVDFPDFTPETRPTDNPLLSPLLAGYRKISDDPLRHDMTLDMSRGRRTTMTTMRARTLEQQPPHRTVVTIEDMNGVPYPMGKNAALEICLEDTPGGVRLMYNHRFETRSLLHDLMSRYNYNKQLNQAARYFKDGTSSDALAGWRGVAIRLALTLLTVASFSLAFGWWFGAGLALMVLLHEFGHWSAMRLMGYPKARFTLLPFLGGAATPGEPYRSQFHRAVCVLMGPGVSAAVCAVLLAAGDLLASRLSASQIELLNATAMFLGLLNLSQLIPMAPLDGGQLLQLLVQRTGSDIARWVAMAVSGVTCLIAVRFGLYLFIPIALIGIMGLSQTRPQQLLPETVEMTGRQRLAVLAGTIATVAMLTFASAPMLAGIAGYDSPRAAVAALTGWRDPAGDEASE